MRAGTHAVRAPRRCGVRGTCGVRGAYGVGEAPSVRWGFFWGGGGGHVLRLTLARNASATSCASSRGRPRVSALR